MATSSISVRVELKRSTGSINDTAETQSEGDEAVLEVETTGHASKGDDEQEGGLHDEERAGGSEDDEAILQAKAGDAEVTLETKSENGEATSEGDGEWIPVADGALLRPSKTAHVHFKKDGETHWPALKSSLSGTSAKKKSTICLKKQNRQGKQAQADQSSEATQKRKHVLASCMSRA